MSARVGVQPLRGGGEGVEQCQARVAQHQFIVPLQQELDRDGDSDGRPAPRRVLPVSGLKPARPAEQAAFSVPRKSQSAVFDKTLTLPPVNFTAAELVAVAVTLARAGTTPFAAATRSALRKVLAAAPPGQAAEAAELMNRVRLIDLDRPGARPGPGRGRPAG